MTWRRVASIKEIEADKALPVVINGRELAIYQLGENFYALEDVCPHAYALLSDGFVDGDVIECPLHQAAFHIPTGKCVAPPADRDLTTFAVKVEGDDIYIKI